MKLGESPFDPYIPPAVEHEAEAAMADPWRSLQAAQGMVNDAGYSRIGAMLDGAARIVGAGQQFGWQWN